MAVAKAAPSHHQPQEMPIASRNITVSVSEASCEFIDQLASQHEGTITKQGVVRLLLQQAEQIGWDPIDNPLTLDRRAAASLSNSSSSSSIKETSKKKSLVRGIVKGDLPSELVPFADLIAEFWKGKKGSKGETALNLLITNLSRIHAKYGADVVKEQLQLGISAKTWNSITLTNYERFALKGPTAAQPQVKHPAAREFRNGRFLDEPEASGGVLDGLL